MALPAESYHITYPERVHYDGSHLTHDVRQTYDVGGGPAAGRRRGRRALRRRDRTAHYRLRLTEAEEVTLDVRPSRRLLAPGLVVERRSQGSSRLRRLRKHCLMQGRLRGRPDSLVAISACQGLVRTLRIARLVYMTLPLWRSCWPV